MFAQVSKSPATRNFDECSPYCNWWDTLLQSVGYKVGMIALGLVIPIKWIFWGAIALIVGVMILRRIRRR